MHPLLVKSSTTIRQFQRPNPIMSPFNDPIIANENHSVLVNTTDLLEITPTLLLCSNESDSKKTETTSSSAIQQGQRNKARRQRVSEEDDDYSEPSEKNQTSSSNDDDSVQQDQNNIVKVLLVKNQIDGYEVDDNFEPIRNETGIKNNSTKVVAVLEDLDSESLDEKISETEPQAKVVKNPFEIEDGEIEDENEYKEIDEVADLSNGKIEVTASPPKILENTKDDDEVEQEDMDSSNIIPFSTPTTTPFNVDVLHSNTTTIVPNRSPKTLQPSSFTDNNTCDKGMFGCHPWTFTGGIIITLILLFCYRYIWRPSRRDIVERGTYRMVAANYASNTYDEIFDDEASDEDVDYDHYDEKVDIYKKLTNGNGSNGQTKKKSSGGIEMKDIERDGGLSLQEMNG